MKNKFNLIFEKKRHWFSVDYDCYTKYPNHEFARLASKLSLMTPNECEGLVESINDADNGQYYEEFFALDADSASDDDEIHISPPNIIIDNTITISFVDMKMLLQEWIDFRVK